MELATKQLARKIIFLSLALFGGSILGAQSKVSSLWLLSFSNISRPLQVAIERDLRDLPARLLTITEKEFWREEPEDLEALKRQNDATVAESELDFNVSNSRRSQAFRTSYLATTTPSINANAQDKIPDWAPLSFKTQKKPNLEKDQFAVGSLVFSSSSRVNDPLLALVVTLNTKTDPPQILEFAFPKSTPAQEMSLQIRDALAGVLLNYEWLRLSPKTEPTDALITVEDNTLTQNDHRLLYFPSERLPVVLNVSREGFESKSRRIENPEDLGVPIILEPLAPKTFQISSEPAGANLYLDNLFLGETPFQFEAVPKGKILSVQSDGLPPQYLELSKLQSQTFLDLNKNLQDYNLERLRHHRVRFYASLSTLLLSLIPTAVFASLDINAQKLEIMGNHPNRALTQSLLWGSVSLNVGALIWNIVESVLYVQQASKTAQP